MDRSLWLLLRLRLVGWLRHWSRNLRTPKRALLALIGALLFLPVPIFALLVPRVQIAAQIALIRRYGPLALFFSCLFYVLFADEDRSITYAPAEVDFLFPGPYRSRQLLLYKVVRTLLVAVLTSLFLTCLFAHHSVSFLAAYVGVLLSVELLYLFILAFGLLTSTVGALAFNRRRRLALAVVLVLVGVALVPAGRAAARLDHWEILQRLEQSAVTQAVVVPFRPFLLAFTAERLWPDLVVWAGVATAIDAALLGLILGLNALNLEAAATASTRRYERLRRARSGGGLSDPALGRGRLPALPWWGGIGPNLWRQGTTALRSPSRIAAVWALFLFPLAPVLFGVEGKKTELNPAILVLIGIGTFSFITTSMIGFDFRPDLDRMEHLKTLPIPPTRLVMSQLLVPVTIMTIGQGLALGGLAALRPSETPLLAGAFVLLPLLNLLLVEVENLYFLWFPVRLISGQMIDFQAMGRQLLLMMAKLVTVGLVLGVAGVLGTLVFFLLGENWPAALGLVWLVMAGFAAALVPLVAMAFHQFDVARDTPA